MPPNPKEYPTAIRKLLCKITQNKEVTLGQAVELLVSTNLCAKSAKILTEGEKKSSLEKLDGKERFLVF